eukprot:TRINITY_DN7561_c0_g1_i1.p1 TRINITY_DN7561_c0_g1~~TRINITY_DN7561_c0_g1_i1.p1  ORF type:complete len:1031 (+),score=387.32 TRINITY_DN7561_c0_g1_i1:87-3179(+)
MTDFNQLPQIFAAIVGVDNSIRNEANLALKNIVKQPGCFETVFGLISSGENEVYRQLLVIALDSHINKDWDTAEDVHETNKQYARDHLFQLVSGLSPHLQKMMASSFAAIASIDFPHQWPQLTTSLKQGIESNDKGLIKMVLLILKSVASRFQYRRKDSDKGHQRTILIEEMIQPIFNVASSLAESHDEEDGKLVHLVFKSFYCMCTFEIPAFMDDPTLSNPWFEMMIGYLLKEMPAEEKVLSLDDKKDYSWWKVKHVIMMNLLRYSQRFLVRTNVTKEGKSFCEYFCSTLAPTVLETVIQMLFRMKEGETAPETVSSYMVDYIANNIENAEMLALMKPHLTTIFQQIMLPLLQLNSRDMDYWHNDPNMFWRLNFTVDSHLNVKQAVGNFIMDCCRMRKALVLPLLLPYVMENIQTFATRQDNLSAEEAIVLEAFMGCFGFIIVNLDPESEESAPAIADLMVQGIFPYLESTHGFLRGRAVWVMEQGMGFVATTEEAQAHVAKALVSRIADPEMIVRINASSSMTVLLHNLEFSQVILDHITEVMTALFEVANEVADRDTIGCLGKLVEAFGDNLADIAVPFMSKLIEVFIKTSKLNCPGQEPDDEEVASSEDLLGVIQGLLIEFRKHETYPALCHEVMVLLPRLLDEEHVYLLDTACEVAQAVCLSPTIIDEVWNAFPLFLNAALSEWALGCVECMTVALDNFIARRPEEYATGGMDVNSTPTSFPTIVVEFATTLMDPDLAAENFRCGCRLLMASTRYAPKGSLGPHLKNIVMAACGQFSQVDGEESRGTLCLMKVLEVILCALIHDATSTCAILEEAGALEFVFEKIFGINDEVEEIFDRRLFFFALTHMFEEASTLPASVQPHLLNVLGMAVTQCDKLNEIERLTNEEMENQKEQGAEGTVDISGHYNADVAFDNLEEGEEVDFDENDQTHEVPEEIDVQDAEYEELLEFCREGGDYEYVSDDTLDDEMLIFDDVEDGQMNMYFFETMRGLQSANADLFQAIQDNLGAELQMKFQELLTKAAAASQ